MHPDDLRSLLERHGLAGRFTIVQADAGLLRCDYCDTEIDAGIVDLHVAECDHPDADRPSSRTRAP